MFVSINKKHFAVGVNVHVIEPQALFVSSLGEIFDEPGDHAGEMETSLILHLRPQWVEMSEAGTGQRVPFAIEGLTQSGVWTPRPWSAVHPDTGAGNPRHATAEKGRQYFEAISQEISNVLQSISRARKGNIPYL